MKIGILTFHRCINYGSYWQTRCLADGLQKQGHHVEILDHHSAKVNFAEWKCALQPVLPMSVPSSDIPLYRQKVEKFFHAFESLPLSRAFPLDDPSQMDMYDIVVVGSDEVWNLSHPWYGFYSIFYGDGVRAQHIIAYAASFGNYEASAGLDKDWANKLHQFRKISVRDANSQYIIKNLIGWDVPVVLDPCLQFPSTMLNLDHPFSKPYVAVYGHNFSKQFVQNTKRWAQHKNISLVSIGYRNDWADEQWLTAGPLEFASFMSGAEAIVSNFFHGCVFALINAKPFVCETSSYRSLKIRDLMKTCGAQHHIMHESNDLAGYVAGLAEPLNMAVLNRLEDLRVFSSEWLNNALVHNTSHRYEFV